MNKNKPRKTLVGEGRISMLVKTDNSCAFSRGRKGYILTTSGKKPRTGFTLPIFLKMKKEEEK